MRLKLFLFLLFLSGYAGLLNAQNIEYGAALDTNYMLIGDQQQLVLKVRSDVAGISVVFPQLKDTVTKGVEIISGPVRDSLKDKDGKWMFEERYVITAFDTGVYIIPSFPITVKENDYNSTVRTEPLGFVVNTYQVDEQKGNYDIVMPYSAPLTFAEVLPYILWTLLGLAIIGLVWWYLVKRRKNQPLFAVKKETIPPYVKAIKSLDEIKTGKLWQAGREKEYYTRLTDTLREYIDDEFAIPAMEQTSFETIRALEKCNKVEAKEKDKVAQMLETADYVKFAKFIPLQDENARYLDTAYEFVNGTHERLEREKAAIEESKRQEQEEAEKREGMNGKKV